MKRVLMLEDRPVSPTEKHLKGQSYPLNDDLADYYLSIGVARYDTLQQFDVNVDRDVETGGEVVDSRLAAAMVGAAGLAPRANHTGRMRFGGAPSSTGVATTALRMTQQAWRFPFDIYGFRLGLESNLAAATTFSLCKAAVVDTSAMTLTEAFDSMSTLHTATPFNVTWAGSAGDTVLARAAADDPDGITWSDWSYNFAPAFGTLASRMLWPDPSGAWAYPYSGTGLTFGALLAADPDIAVMHWHDTTDRVTGWTSWGVTTANGTGNLSIPFIEVLTSRRIVVVAAVGDSTLIGQVDSGNASLAPVWAACDDYSTAALQYVPICRGWGGKEPFEYYNYALDLIANYTPDIMFYQAWSQNDETQSVNVQEIALALDVKSRCAAAGIAFIPITGIPINGGNSTMEAARLAQNQVVRAIGGVICDADAVLSNQAAPVAGYLPAFGSGVHPNTAGYAALVAEYGRCLRATFS